MSGKKMQTILIVVAIFLIGILFLVVVKNFSNTSSQKNTLPETEKLVSRDAEVFFARNFISGVATVAEDNLVDFDLDGRAEHIVVYQDTFSPEMTKKIYSFVIVGNNGQGWNKIETPNIQADTMTTKKFIAKDGSPALLIEFNKDGVFSWSILSWDNSAFRIFDSKAIRSEILTEAGYDPDTQLELVLTKEAIIENIPPKITSEISLLGLTITYEFTGEKLQVVEVNEKE